jgi:hypothetical protein
MFVRAGALVGGWSGNRSSFESPQGRNTADSTGVCSFDVAMQRSNSSQVLARKSTFADVSVGVG